MLNYCVLFTFQFALTVTVWSLPHVFIKSRIFLTLKIPPREVFENHLYAYSVIAVQDDFSVLSDFFHD